MATNQKPRAVYVIAEEIVKIWSKQGNGINYAARPYLMAMMDIGAVTDMYGQDSGDSIVRYFLSNATSFRGDDARRLKAELKALL